MDVIACFDSVAVIKEWTLTEAKFKNAYDIYTRKSVFEYYYLWYLEDILRIVKGFPEVNFRHLVLPDEKLVSSYIPIFDDIEVNFDLLAQGEEDARNMLTAYLKSGGHHHYFDETDIEFHHDHDHDLHDDQTDHPEVKSTEN